ncbi:MAG: hypothetical protein ACXW32_05500 [Limisphaerales bacterium]
MKTFYSFPFVAFVLTLAAFVTPAHATTSPETNALISEVEIGAPTAIAEGRFGQLIAARSNLVVIGYRTTFESNPSGPLAAVYRKSAVPRNFDFQGELRVPGVTNLTVWDLVTDGNRIGISAYINADEHGVNGSPVIYLFAHDDTQWILETTLVPSENIRSFALSENVIVAGAAAASLPDASKVIVFEKINGAWEETIIFPPDDAISSVKNGYGTDVAVQGGNILVGATGDTRTDEGHAYLYSRVEGAWRLQADLAHAGFSVSLFGTRVAIDGDTALVTRYSGRNNTGNVYVFERSDSGWSEVGHLSSAQGPEDYFGLVLAICGKNIVVGAPEVAWGSAYLFRKNGAVFDRLQLYRAPYHGEYPEHAFGTSVAVDRNTVYVGAPLYDGSSVTNQGVAYAFEFSFPPQLHSTWARHSDNSFHFAVTELEVGKTYTIETCSSLGTEWTFLKAFTAYAPDMQLEVELSTESGGRFFRLARAHAAFPASHLQPE